jgi:hypothetical protein
VVAFGCAKRLERASAAEEFLEFATVAAARNGLRIDQVVDLQVGNVGGGTSACIFCINLDTWKDRPSSNEICDPNIMRTKSESYLKVLRQNRDRGGGWKLVFHQRTGNSTLLDRPPRPLSLLAGALRGGGLRLGVAVTCFALLLATL